MAGRFFKTVFYDLRVETPFLNSSMMKEEESSIGGVRRKKSNNWKCIFDATPWLRTLKAVIWNRFECVLEAKKTPFLEPRIIIVANLPEGSVFHTLASSGHRRMNNMSNGQWSYVKCKYKIVPMYLLTAAIGPAWSFLCHKVTTYVFGLQMCPKRI